MRFELEHEGETEELVSYLAYVERQMEDASQPIRESLRDVVQVDVMEQFATEGQGAWPQLSEKYAQWKLKTVGDEPLLVLFGKMVAAAGSPDAISVRRDEGTYTIDRPNERGVQVPPFHQDGTSKMPARPLLGQYDDEHARIERIFDDWLEDQVKGSRVKSLFRRIFRR